MSLVAFLVIGLLSGLFSRSVFADAVQARGLWGTLGLGIAGAFLGGFIGLAFHSTGEWFDFEATAILWSTFGAVVTLAIAAVSSTLGIRAE